MLSGKFAVLVKLMSTGVISTNSLCKVFFNDKLDDNIEIVINNIKQITLILITVVFILLFNCLNINIFVPLKYVFFIDCTTRNIKPDNDQKIKIVDTIPNIIGGNSFSALSNV